MTEPTTEDLLAEILHEAIIEELLLEDYPQATPEQIALIKSKCTNPWDASILYSLIYKV